MSRAATGAGAPAMDVRAALTFIVPQAEKPRFESAALTGGEPRIHFRTEQREVTVHDMRPLAASLGLDRTGFELLRHHTQVGDLYDDDEVDRVYRGELEVLLREHSGAREARVFDLTRRSDAPSGARNRDGARGPAGRVHVDYTIDSGPRRAADALGAAVVEQVLRDGGRIVQVNVWRPIRGPVERTPLALGDASSIGARERVATDQVFPDRVGEIYQVAWAPGQRWYWAPHMQRDEVILIKGWDSRQDVRARFTPHGAFELPGQDDSAPPRESIEARAYLLFDRP